MKQYLAIDIGASSGRHIVGWREDGEIKTKEVYRFPNGVLEQNGHLIWDVDALLAHVKTGIAAAKAEFSGPIPPPSIIEGYERVLPGSADRIISMAEKQSAKSQDSETTRYSPLFEYQKDAQVQRNL